MVLKQFVKSSALKISELMIFSLFLRLLEENSILVFIAEEMAVNICAGWLKIQMDVSLKHIKFLSNEQLLY